MTRTPPLKGFGFVEMPKAGEPKAAIITQRRDVAGSRIPVKKAESKPHAESSLAG